MTTIFLEYPLECLKKTRFYLPVVVVVNMEKWKYTRKLFMIAAFAIFVFQSYTALRKYWQSPTIIINSETTWDSIERPRIGLDIVAVMRVKFKILLDLDCIIIVY